MTILDTSALAPGGWRVMPDPLAMTLETSEDVTTTGTPAPAASTAAAGSSGADWGLLRSINIRSTAFDVQNTRASPVSGRQSSTVFENSSEGAIATATYFVQLYPYVYATGDLEQWKSMSRQDCLFCNSVITNVKELHESGGWRDPWAQTVVQSGYSDPGPGSEYSRVDIAFDRDTTYTYDGTGGEPEVAEPHSYTVIIFAMKYTDGHWIIREGEVE